MGDVWSAQALADLPAGIERTRTPRGLPVAESRTMVAFSHTANPDSWGPTLQQEPVRTGKIDAAKDRDVRSNSIMERTSSVATKPKTFKTSIDIPAGTRAEIIDLCNQQLADTADLQSQIKQAHWNIKGPEFIALHKLYDELAEEVEGYIDEIAERVTQLGGYANGTVRMAAANSRLPEFPTDATLDMDTVAALVERYANYAASTRAAIDEAEKSGDATTADLFTQISGGIDKGLWFLEAHLQK
jgi:starvation-inducible DNA-binding protein